MYKILNILIICLFILGACNQQLGDRSSSDDQLSIEYEKYTLPNGLDVILHQDKSDPIVAVAILVHAGSNREKAGRTGFAHFFEHMLFQRSENVPEQAFFTNIQDWGGTFNGGTWEDGTVYFEVVPKDALEKVLWMESDRMGFFINSVTKASLEGEKPVVKNEKRQRVDNQAYGHTNYVIKKALYPPGHPYNWTVIGELEDLTNATLEDVKEFYDLYYGPNNASLVLAGDFDTEQTKAWVEKYFGEIQSRGIDKPMDPKPVVIEKNLSLFHEDAFANVPEIKLTWSTVEHYHPDSWALDVLGEILSDGKRAPLYKEVVEKRKLTPGVSAFQDTKELAGTFTISAKANDATDLDSVYNAIFEGLSNFEKQGVNQKDLDRIKTSLETDFYSNISSVFSKAFQLALYNEFAGNPSFITEDINKIKAVTKEDIMNVYNKYIKDKNFITTSFVPKGQPELTVSGALRATVKEEAIVPHKETALLEKEGDETFEKTPSSFDRTIEPQFGEAPLFTPPDIWSDKANNGMGIYGVESTELPLVNFSLRIRGGLSLESPEKLGVTNLLVKLMKEGTRTKTPEELEDAIGQLGSNINIQTSSEFITISGNCLSRNYESTMALVEEILIDPRWDQKEFDRIKTAATTKIRQRDADPNSIAQMVLSKQLYGEDIMSMPISGTLETVEPLTMEDLKNFYTANFSPSIANFHVVGNVSQEQVKSSIGSLNKSWKAKEVSFPSPRYPEVTNEPKVFFVDVPSAKQSVIQIGRLAVSRSDEEYFPLVVSNYKLGAGSASRLFNVLREEKGYTYGAYSYLASKRARGPWIAASSVRSNVTLEALQTFKEVIGGYRDTYTEEDLKKTKIALMKRNTRRFETLGNLLGILQNISTYNLPVNYINEQQQTLQNLTFEDVKRYIDKYLNLNNMYYVIVGDKATQYDRLKVEGKGSPVEVDKYGNTIVEDAAM